MLCLSRLVSPSTKPAVPNPSICRHLKDACIVHDWSTRLLIQRNERKQTVHKELSLFGNGAWVSMPQTPSLSYPQPHTLKHTFTHWESGMCHSGLCLDSSPVTLFAFDYHQSSSARVLLYRHMLEHSASKGSNSVAFSVVAWIRITGWPRLK